MRRPPDLGRADRRLWSVGHAWARSSRPQPPHAEPHDAVSAAETVSGRRWGSLGSGLPGGCSWAMAGPPGKSRVHIADGVTAGADGSAHRSLSRMPACRARTGAIVYTRSTSAVHPDPGKQPLGRQAHACGRTAAASYAAAPDSRAAMSKSSAARRSPAWQSLPERLADASPGGGDGVAASRPSVRACGSGAGGDEHRDRGSNFTAPPHYDPCSALPCAASFT